MLRQTQTDWIQKGLRIVYLLAALLPAVWVLSRPMPVAWLRPLCKDTSQLAGSRGYCRVFFETEGERLVIVGNSANPGQLPGVVL
jgi:hypothetical protein